MIGHIPCENQISAGTGNGKTLMRSSLPWKERVKALKRETFTLYLACRHPRVPWYAKVLGPSRRRLRPLPDRSDPGFHPGSRIPGRPDPHPAGDHARHPDDPGGGPRGVPSKIGGDRGKGDAGGEDRGRGDRCDLDPLGGAHRLAHHKDCKSSLKRAGVGEIVCTGQEVFIRRIGSEGRTYKRLVCDTTACHNLLYLHNLLDMQDPFPYPQLTKKRVLHMTSTAQVRFLSISSHHSRRKGRRKCD